ncbi:hypothetical protein GF420_01590 [candidate division GN15 bacterium]|nr:hypothetical protein [candidate division GN15 bacterium]
MNALSKAAYTRALVAVLGVLMLLAAVGCNRITGDQTPNRAPEVYFVNVPPDGHQTSFDPVVYWYGTDIDGTIATYRYIVVREDEMGTTTDPEEYANTVLPNVPTSEWTYLDVPPEDPQTTNIIPMSASLDDPISTFVPQYVFLQAYDNLGAASPIIWKLFQRNDNPPGTDILVSDQVFINAEEPGGAITGLRFSIVGEDPDEADSLFEFRWRIFGPYTSDEESDTAQWERLAEEYFKPAVVTVDAQVFISGYGLQDTVTRIVVTPGGVDTLVDIVLIDTAVQSDSLDPFYGRVEQIFDIEAFRNDPELYKPVDSSWENGQPWVSNNRSDTYRDSLYDLFRNETNTETQQRNFLLWTQSRDAAKVVDATPNFRGIEVVDPKYERDILVLDMMSFFGRINAPLYDPAQGVDSARSYWTRAITRWVTNHQPDADFVPSRDIVRTESQGSGADAAPLGQLLSYKVVILYNDYLNGSGISDPTGFSTTELGVNLYTAIDAGVNIWGCWRTPLVGGTNQTPIFASVVPTEYTRYFGVTAGNFSGWGALASRQDSTQRIRIEDFVGAASLLSGQGWPDVAIDTHWVHQRYNWLIRDGGDSSYAWIPFAGAKPDPDIFAYPEVNWSVRAFGTEVIYLYQSVYSPELHPLGIEFTFEGAPVALRYETDLYRTAHFNFTPVAMNEDQIQVVVDSVLNWLYDPGLDEPTTSTRYQNARVRVGVDNARANYIERTRRMDDLQGSDERSANINW